MPTSAPLLEPETSSIPGWPTPGGGSLAVGAINDAPSPLTHTQELAEAELCLPAATVFSTRPYLNAYRRFFGAGKTFHRLRVPGGGAYLMTRGRTAKRLEWWGAGIHDIGGANVASAGAAAQLWQAIEAMARSRHAARLAQMPAGDPLVRHAVESGWKVTDADVCPVLALPDSYAQYVRSLGKNMREQIRRYPRRLEKEFRVECELAHGEAAIQAALSDLFRLHGKRWRARGQPGVLATRRRQSFHRAVCSDFGRRGWLRLWSLRCNGQTACVLLNYFHGGKYYFFIGGFEPDLMRWSVGTCLFARVLEHAIGEGATEFDFLRGAEEYKYRFGAVDRAYKTITYHDDSARGRLLKQRMHLEHRVMSRLTQTFSAANRTKGARSAP